MRWTWLLLVLTTPLSAAGPGETAVLALRDAVSQGVQAVDTRYLYFPEPPVVQRAAIHNLQPNLLSRESEIILPRRIGGSLLAIKLSDYGLSPSTWEQLAFGEPYCHEIQIIPVGSGYRAYARATPGFKAGWYTFPPVKVETKVAQSASWMPKEHLALIETCQTLIPLVRADWFFAQTCVSNSRVGYYDFLGIKSRADAEKLAGLDRKTAEARKKVMRAVLIESGVALQNRQIEWLAAYDGDWWATLDSFVSTGKNNAPRLLDDQAHDAEEIYFRLPNGLPGMLACDAKGVIQKTVPDSIAHNKAARNDKRIHAPLGCMECHVEVIRPFSCDARQLYRGRIRLESPDPFRFIKLRQLYLSDIYAVRERSAAGFAAAIHATTGLKPAEVALAYGEEYDRYYRPLATPQIALELGVPVERLRAAIEVKVAQGLADPVLLNSDHKVKREHFEEAQSVYWDWLREAK